MNENTTAFCIVTSIVCGICLLAAIINFSPPGKPMTSGMPENEAIVAHQAWSDAMEAYYNED